MILPDDSDATIVNGWLIENTGNIPQKGFVLIYENLEITVTEADDLMTYEISVRILES